MSDEKINYILSDENENIFSKHKNIISNLNNNLKNISYSKKLNYISKNIEFIRCFSSSGVQGIVGTVLLKDNKQNKEIIFKTSKTINNSVEHEYEILKHLESLRKYCPHFVRPIGMIEIPISTKFINDSEDTELFYNSDETLTRNILFTEYLNKYSFFRMQGHYGKIFDKNIIFSQMLQILMALEIAQIEKKFTHYDLHDSNILIQKCETDSIFLYKLNGEFFSIPTFGFFPVIIDCGMSYSECVEGKFINTHTNNYDNGYQSTLFDKLNDIHHLVVSVMYEMETYSDGFDSLSNKIKYIFRHIPIMKKSGWKSLPNDIANLMITKIKEDCRIYSRFYIFKYFDREVIEIFNNLIKLPMKHKTNDSFDPSFTTFMKEFHVFINVDDFSKYDSLFVLKTFVENINKYRYQYFSNINNPSELTKVIISFRDDIYNIISKNLPYDINYDIDYEKLLVSAITFSEILESNYYDLIEEHKYLLIDKYDKTIVKSPIDMYIYISRNMTPNYYVDKNTIIYFWDIDNKKKSKIDFQRMQRNNLDKINKVCFLDKGKLIYEEIKNN